MEIPQQLESLHQAVSSTSLEDIGGACSWLQSNGVVGAEDQHKASAALRALKAFFQKVERHP
jgi:hypothetical protein